MIQFLVCMQKGVTSNIN